MKKALDKFSNQSGFYKKFRPVYPKQLYDCMLTYVTNRDRCWDCGTGNGQVAIELSKYFDHVDATDISAAQIEQASRRQNILYDTGRAERTKYADNSFDLITVAQAVHWFDQNAFCLEVNRVARPNAIVAIWGYGLPQIDDKVDKALKRFYDEVVGLYWDEARRHIEQSYSNILFDFIEIELSQNFHISLNWSKNDYLGYLRSWSSVQNYKSALKADPVIWIEDVLAETWPIPKSKPVNFPIFLRLGRVQA